MEAEWVEQAGSYFEQFEEYVGLRSAVLFLY